MEVSGVVSRQLPSFSGVGIDSHSHHSSPNTSFAVAGARFPGKIRQLGLCETRVSLKPRKFSGFLSSGFCDDGHLRYYNGPSAASTTCGGGKKEKVKDTAAKKMKKKLKLVKGLKKDLSMFSEMGFGLEPDHDLANQVKGKMISEATELLIQQLQQLKAEEKELKRKRKEEKAKLKALQMKGIPNCELSSSDSSSESSDSECEQVVDMNQLKTEATSSITHTLDREPTQLFNSAEPLSVQVYPAVLANERDSSDKCCRGSCTEGITSNVANAGCTSQKIEVCMGGKCKKLGGAALLEEFQSRVGGEGSVVGCKCMGKCRDGPNVRVLNNVVEAEGVDGSVRAPANPLCIGVGLEDVGLIVDNFFGRNGKDLGLVGAS